MWHLRASPKKQHFILNNSEFKKTVVVDGVYRSWRD